MKFSHSSVPATIAAAEATLTKRQKELGVITIDIGAGCTSVAVYEEGTILHSVGLPIGGESVTNDIAIGLRTPIDKAEHKLYEVPVDTAFGFIFINPEPQAPPLAEYLTEQVTSLLAPYKLDEMVPVGMDVREELDRLTARELDVGAREIGAQEDRVGERRAPQLRRRDVRSASPDAGWGAVAGE